MLTILGIVLLLWAVPPIFNFLVGHAVFPGGTVEDCRAEGAGACWAYIAARFNFFIYGFYPIDQYWRPNIMFIMGAALIIPLLMPSAPFKRINAVLFFLVFPVVSFYLLNGGVFGMTYVPTGQWGGLMVTLIISLVGIICSIPLGILLALGRQSTLPIIKTLCVMFIELWRAVPLITVLFMASIMLPLFMPTGTNVDKLLRALVGVTLFSSAYLAETVRGGLQALPRGQYEAGASLGLGYWKRTYFIILPQALKHVIPGIVNNFIALFKDTSLVSIVGIFDLLNTVQAASSDIEWASPTQAVTGYVFAAFMFWIFCFAMSRYSLWMERRLDTGHKR
jgi:general L-amino acid transport system permease protein